MKLKEAVRRRDALARAIGQPNEIVRGSLLKRTIRHKRGCQTCARGEGHLAWVLSINYPGGRNKQLSIRPWPAVFAPRRTFVRAARQALGSLLVLGRATLSRIVWTSGREQQSWSGE